MVVATGFFDGVHTGHRLVISQLVNAAEARGEESLVITFWPHPRNVLQLEARTFRLLSSLEEKKRMLRELGVDRIEVIPFTREFGALTTREYLDFYVKRMFGGTAVVLGYDNRMGSDSMTPHDVGAVARSLGLDVIMTGMVEGMPGTAVSSTRIRTLIASGDVKDASAMLGYDYSLYGVVVAGNRIGRTIGFPTANMQLYEPLKLIPGNGVYSVKVHTLGREWAGMCNIGNRPTVGAGNPRTVETNIFGFDEDIYGLDLRVTFLRKIRDEIRFDSIDALGEQLAKDRKVCLACRDM
ncbi:MAG: riboflavin biosynthesis protein RibF [Bacteroidetes bacterium]|uniref:Riboflavin biosynthesis protein n=1 Tax=Candidatus Cryptobacteroides excrementipullorum TaxID=2840761 RepID=A0A9D9NL92_9BACT|nr:riboflavin biosynthesis protein RibF [Candidatus Cryptobacteroides excrementipullorum]